MVGQMIEDFADAIQVILQRENFLLPDANNQLLIPKAYAHALPSTSKQEPIRPPYVVVSLYNGEQISATDPEVVTLHIIDTVHDANKNMQGYRDAMQLLDVIRRNLYSCPIVANRYEVVYPYQFAAIDDERYPYFSAGLAIKVELPGTTPQNPIGGYTYV